MPEDHDSFISQDGIMDLPIEFKQNGLQRP
jgi:hypothetical protein